MRVPLQRLSTRLIVGAGVLAMGWTAAPGWASDSDPTTGPAETVLLAQSSRGGAAQFQAGCIECNPPKRFLPALGELMAVQLIPWSINHFARDAEWADISPETWWTNMSNPWLWDNNQFLNNQFSHPYHGNLYFNAGRANGYSFWESSVWAGGGSLMWELYGEAWAPSPNDWFNTTLGGISLGEMLWRVSSLALDNTTTGSERTWREIGAGALNPVRGFSRLVNGQTHGVRPNPEEWRPSRAQASFDIGDRRTSGFKQGEDLDQLYGELLLAYGDQVDDVGDKPFSACFVTLEIAPNQPQGIGSLSQLRARGSLGAHTLSRGANQVHKLAAFMTYEYFNSPAFQFGGQGFHGGLVSRWGKARGKRTQLEVLGSFLPISALRSDHYVTLEGRDYDYGPSFGGSLRLARIWEGKGWLQANGRTLYTPIVSGFNGDHIQATAAAEGRFFLNGRIGAGASWTYYFRNSWYDDFPDVRQDGRQYRAFLSYAFPRWQP